jgi:hypothetical protein
MYGLDLSLTAEDWVGLGLCPSVLRPADRKRLVEEGILEPHWLEEKPPTTSPETAETSFIR